MTRIHRAALIVTALALAVLAPLSAYAQISRNVDFRGRVDEYAEYSDIWGYTDENGNEYAILGTRNGTSIINVTIPDLAYETGFIPGPSSIWRDMKVYGDYAYIVTEGGGGMQIVDLTDPEFPQPLPNYTAFSSAHNIYIDEANARAYPCGTNNGGTYILDLTSPTNPVALGNYTTRYVHDLWVLNGIAYLAEINNASLTVADFSNPGNIIELGGPITYPGAFTHNVWPTTGQQFVLTTDELAGGHINIWNVTALPNITFASEWRSPVTNSVIHNVLVDGDFAYISHYTEGLRILDIDDPFVPVEVAFYDTWTGASGGFNGAWGVYPYLPSGNILVSDQASGLFILDMNVSETKLKGQVLEVGGGTVDGALVEIVEAGVSTTSNSTGNFAIYVDPGTYTVRTTREGFVSLEETVVVSGIEIAYNPAIERLPSGVLAGQVNAFGGGARLPVGNASLSLSGTGFTATGDENGNYAFGLVPAGSYDVVVQRPGYRDVTVPVLIQTTGANLDILMEPSVWFDDASTDMGWSLFQPGDGATTGQWERAIPIGSGGGSIQPDVDATPGNDGVCFITGNAATAQENPGVADIDNGATTLTSPALDLSGMSDPYLRYSRWYVNEAGGNPGTDLFRAQISDDDGASWVGLEILTNDNTPWTQVEFRVLDFVAATNEVRVRFIAEDAGQPSLVEAGIDDVEIYEADLSATDAPDAFGKLATLQQNRPNPFNPKTELSYRLAQPGRVRLDIVDVRGRLVKRLLNEDMPAGNHTVQWDARDHSGRTLASGVYMAVLDALGERTTRKMLLAK